jgi:SOS-response transcriptional repressor LexA
MEVAICESASVFQIGDVVRKLRNDREWTVEELGKRAGVNKMTVSALERGSSYRRETLERVAAALDTTVPAMFTLLSPRGVARRPQDDDVEIDPVDVSGYSRDALPVILEGEASPQPGLFWDDEGKLLREVEDRISRPYDVKDPKAYGVRVRGDSMAPAYKPGMTLVVSPSTPTQDGDEVYVELLSGERLIKIARKMAGGWLLESINPAHEPRFVTKGEVGTMHPVLWARRMRSGERTVTATGYRVDRRATGPKRQSDEDTDVDQTGSVDRGHTDD